MAKELRATTTVTFNVGGHPYVVARDTIERYPETMLANMVSQRWQQDSNDNSPLFIDSDGHRFRYVLDWMRHGEVYLPVTESYDAFRRDLGFYGFQNVEDSSIIAGTLEGGQILTTTSSNLYEENDALEEAIMVHKKKINEIELHQKSNNTAHQLFVRSSSVKEGDTVKISLIAQDEKTQAFFSFKYDMDYLRNRLEQHGLKLLHENGESRGYPNEGTAFACVVQRIQKKKRKTDEHEGASERKKVSKR